MTATRRRGPALEDAILDAGWQQLVSEGYAGFTFEAVAERAQTGKAVLYRRWPDKEALLLAVLAHWGFENSLETPDTGSLRDDVLALLRARNQLGDGAAALFSTVFGAYFDETATTPSQLRTRLLGDRTLAMTEIVQRALERGELTAVPPPRVLMLPFDLFRHELMMNFSRVPEETIVDIVDTVFLPLVLQPGGPAAGFSAS
jgi:AcrR family transcriptional regulator